MYSQLTLGSTQPGQKPVTVHSDDASSTRQHSINGHATAESIFIQIIHMQQQFCSSSSTLGDVVRSIPSYILPFFTVTCTTHPYKCRHSSQPKAFKFHCGSSGITAGIGTTFMVSRWGDT